MNKKNKILSLLTIIVFGCGINSLAADFSANNLFGGGKSINFKKSYVINKKDENKFAEIYKNANIKKTKVSTVNNYQQKSDKEIKMELLQKELKNLKKQKEFIFLLTKYNQKEKNINVKAKTKYINIFIPLNQISEVTFDKKIASFQTINNKRIDIKPSKDKKTLIITNKDYMLNQNIKITFADNTDLNIVLKVGQNINKRYIKYNLYLEDKTKGLIPEYQKKLKIINVHTYFNQVAIDMIFNTVLQTKEYEKYLLNRKIIKGNKGVVYDGKATIIDLDGKKTIDYKARVVSIYDTAYLKQTPNGDKLKLIMLEVNITNKGNNTLVMTEDFIKNRFANYVAFYVGDITKHDNYVQPGQTKKILIVTEEHIKER